MIKEIEMEIRKLKSEDISQVVELWYETSIEAHDFISADYWKENKEAMATQYFTELRNIFGNGRRKYSRFHCNGRELSSCYFCKNLFARFGYR